MDAKTALRNTVAAATAKRDTPASDALDGATVGARVVTLVSLCGAMVMLVVGASVGMADVGKADGATVVGATVVGRAVTSVGRAVEGAALVGVCLLYTSDAADD